ncbi:MAG: thioredoxin family protein [Myxococcota bacterium]
MAATASTMLTLGTPCPDFRLPDPSGKLYGRDDFAAAPGLLVMFICNHCPYVKHIRTALAALTRSYEGKIGIVAINANDANTHPDDAPPRMAEEARDAGYTFPYLFDETQEVAKVFRAACTPELYLFDGERRLYYRGQFDDSRPGNGKPVTGKDLRAAIDALLRGDPPPREQTPSVGCNIKWKPGNAPAYFG